MLLAPCIIVSFLGLVWSRLVVRGKLDSGLGGQYAALVCLNTTNGDIPQPDMLHGPMNIYVYLSFFFSFFFFFFSCDRIAIVICQFCYNSCDNWHPHYIYHEH